MSTRSITQKDIAQRLNVSRSHVASVLACNPNTRASEATKRAILQTAQEMEYVAHDAARLLRNGKSGNILLTYVAPDPKSEKIELARFGHAVALELGLAGFRLNIRAFADNETAIASMRKAVGSRAADAVMLMGYEGDVEEQARALTTLGSQFAVYGVYDAKHPEWYQSDYDHIAMIDAVVNRLADNGHTRIAYLGHDSERPYARRYRDGFRAAFKSRFGHQVPADWMLWSEETAESALAIKRRINDWMALPAEVRPTALACGEGGSVIPAVELAFLANGIVLGDGPGQFEMAGWFQFDRMIAGSGWVYSPDDRSGMVRKLVHDQLIPLAQGREPEDRIIRYCPQLRRSTPPIFFGDLKQWFRTID